MKKTTSIAVLLLAAWAVNAAIAQTPVPFEADFNDDAGFCFRAEFADGRVTLRRTDMELPQRGQMMPAYNGAALTLGEIAIGPSLTGVSRTAVAQTAAYGLQSAVTLSRLSPAVLVDTTQNSIGFKLPVAYAACVSGGRVVVKDASALKGALPMDEPWLLVWFGKGSTFKGYLDVADVSDEHTGADSRALAQRRAIALDMPMLIRLERKPTSVVYQDGLTLGFASAAGKVAIMPLFGGRGFEPALTQTWARGLPGNVLAQCRLWAAKLRDYPVSVAESFSVAPDRGEVTIRQQFEFICFDDDWKSPPVMAAPVPPMLGLALGGGVEVSFRAGGKPVTAVDYGLMDVPGKAMGIEGVTRYEYIVSGLSKLIAEPPLRAVASPQASDIVSQLESHVREMIDAGHLAPLLMIHGGLGSAAGYYYWANSPDLAAALQMAWPYLPEELRGQARRYLQSEWAAMPPWTDNTGKLRAGANRAPYDAPTSQARGAGDQTLASRERSIRAWTVFGDLYGIDAYYRLTGHKPPDAVRQKAAQLAGELVAHQDWALLSPIWRAKQTGFFDGNYYSRNGQATTNVRLAGAIGLLRLSRANNWASEEQLGWYLLAKQAMARVGQARYVAELHRMGHVRGDGSADWRTLVDINRQTAICLRGHIMAVSKEDQEIPPFIYLTPEVGRLLGTYARAECAFYLDNLDRSMPLYWISEAPKQSASEQRLCPLMHKSGNVLAQFYVLGKRGEAFGRYVDITRFKGDLYYIQNLAALIESYGPERN